MNTTQAAQTLTADGYAVTTWTDHRGDEHMSAKSGSRVCDVSAEGRVTMWIDYGSDGRCLCDAVTLKTGSGAVRRIRKFLA